MTTIQFTRPARLTRNAFRNVLQGLGRTWYCTTIEGKRAFAFPESNTAVLVDTADYNQFMTHLRSEEGYRLDGGETSDNWG